MKKNVDLSPNEILEEKIDRLHRKKEWKRFLVECVVIVAAVFVIFQYVIGIAFVGGASMKPALEDGELVVFYRLDRAYQKNDIAIIHRQENVEYIKRIVALPGDVVELDEEGALWVNGEKETSTEARTFAYGESIAYPYTVPADSYFVLGDNRENSRDSREFGAVKKEEITGRVFLHMGMTE